MNCIPGEVVGVRVGGEVSTVPVDTDPDVAPGRRGAGAGVGDDGFDICSAKWLTLDKFILPFVVIRTTRFHNVVQSAHDKLPEKLSDSAIIHWIQVSTHCNCENSRHSCTFALIYVIMSLSFGCFLLSTNPSQLHWWRHDNEISVSPEPA